MRPGSAVTGGLAGQEDDVAVGAGTERWATIRRRREQGSAGPQRAARAHTRRRLHAQLRNEPSGSEGVIINWYFFTKSSLRGQFGYWIILTDASPVVLLIFANYNFSTK